MGGLRKFMPVTAMTFVVGWLAIAGVIPFAGFWSKDEILAKAWAHHSYGAVGRRRGRRALHRVLHDPPGVAGVLRPGAVPRRARRRRRRARRARGARAARVARDDAHPARGARGAVARRRLHQPAVHEAVVRRPRAAGSSPRSWAAARSRSARSATGFALSTGALVVAVVGIVSGRAVYRNGLTADGDDPIDAKLGPRRQGVRERVLLRHRHRRASSAARSPRSRGSSPKASTAR